MSDEPSNPLSVDSDQFDRMIKEMEVHCAIFAKVCNDFEQTLGPMQAGFHALKLSQILKMLNILSFLHDVGEEVKKYKGREGGTLERVANEIMEDEEIEAIKQDGYTWKPDTKNCYSIPEDKKQEFIEWAKQHPVASELVKEEIHYKTQEKLFNEMQENAEPLPPMVSCFRKPIIVRRKNRS